MGKRKKINSINCEEALERMFDYIDSALAGKSGTELEHHIETCRGCMKKLDFQLRLKKRLVKIKPVSVSKNFANRLNIILEKQTA